MNKFESNYGNTESGILRNCFMFDTYTGKAYLDDNNQIVGLESDNINGGKLIGETTNILIENLGVGNIVKHIIEEGKYNSLPELFEELSIAYKQRLVKILSDDNNITEYEQKLAA